MSGTPFWWDFVTQEERAQRLLVMVRNLESELLEIKQLNDPLNVKTRDRILLCEQENAKLHKKVSWV
jgi:hypothetical protein